MKPFGHITGQLLLQLNAKGFLIPANLTAGIHYLKNHMFKPLTVNGNVLIVDLAFEGNAVIKIEGNGIAPKWIQIVRFHSAPFPKQGGFCLSINLFSASMPTPIVSEEEVRIFSANFIEHVFVSEDGLSHSRPLHNLESNNNQQALSA